MQKKDKTCAMKEHENIIMEHHPPIDNGNNLGNKMKKNVIVWVFRKTWSDDIESKNSS